MKNIKRVISLVLVLAMLASFAGMTGYSPVSIEAEAAGDQDKTVITTSDGLRIEMATVLYKHRALDAETITIDGSSTTDKNDYIISTEHNYNLDYSLTFPASVTHFKGSLSLDGVSYGGLWGTLSKDNWNNGSVAYFYRSGKEAQNYDYGGLYSSRLKGKGVEGFRDVEKIYWKIEYSSDGGSTFASYVWSVDVEFAPISLEFTKSAVNYGKPNGSFAATNVASLDIPHTLYTDGSKVIKSFTAYDTSRSGYNTTYSVDTTLTVTVPGAAYVPGGTTDYNGDGTSDAYIRLNIIDFAENIKYVYSLGSGYDPYPSGLTEDGKVVYPAVNSATGTISANGSNWDVTFDLEGLTHIDVVDAHKYICYRIDYIVPQTTMSSASNDSDGIPFSELGIETQNVVYSQFAASAVKTVPNFRTTYKVNDFGGYGKNGDYKYSFNYYQIADFFNFINTTGVTAETSFRSSSSSPSGFSYLFDVDGTKRWYGIYASMSAGFSGGSGFQNWLTSGTEKRVGSEGDPGSVATSMQANAIASPNSLGATIFYDKYYVSNSTLTSLTFSLKNDYIANSSYHTNYISTYSEKIYAGVGRAYEYFGTNGYAVKGSGWQATGASSTADITYGDMSSLSSGKSSNSVSGKIARASDGFATGNPVTGTKTSTYNVIFSGMTGTAGTAEQFTLVTMNASPYYYDDNGTAADEGSTTGVGLAYHIDVIPVDRTSSHTLIDNAIKNNYIKAEMNGNWWKTYRENVLYAYYNIGYLNSTSDIFNLYNTAILDNPIYDGADYDRLVAALEDNAAYEMGNETSAADGVLINNGTQWTNMGNTSVTGEYYYTADTWARFKAARQLAHSLAFACYRSGGTYNYGYIQDFSNHWDSVNSKYYIHSQTPGLSLLYCYAQDAIEAATEELIAAKNGLKLKVADYSAMGDAINAATNAGDTEYIANHNSATYNSDALQFKVQSGDYTGDYYDYNGQKITVSVGSAVSQKNFSTTTASALRTSLQKRMFVYDWAGDTNGDGMPDNLENGAQVYNYAHSTTFSPIAPASGSFVDNVFTTDYATAENETKLSGGASKYYLSIGYQNAINAAVADINNKAAALRLRINPLALGTAIEDARYIDVDGTSTFLYTLQGSNDNYNDTDVYTQESWDKYVSALQVSVNVIYSQSTPLSQSTSFDYTTLSAKDTDLASGTPYYTTLTYIDANGASQSYTPANRQQEYNMAITNAANAQKLLVKYADYSAALARINGTAYIPEYDMNGASAVTGDYTGADWYTEETWTEFENARNALTNLLYINNGANTTGYNYSYGKSGSYTRGRLTEADQATITNAVNAFDTAKGKLTLKTMTEYVDGSNNTYETINTQVNAKVTELAGSVPVYTIVNNALDKTGTKLSYYNTAELEAAASAVNAITADKTLVGNYAAYEGAVTAFNNKYNETKAAPNAVSEAGWLGIFEHLSILADGTTTSVTASNILANFTDLYVDADGSVKSAMQTILTAYDDAKQGKHLATGTTVLASNAQVQLNEQVEALYNLLTSTSLTSADITAAASAIETEMAKIFTAYNPFDFAKYNEEELYINPLYSWEPDATAHNGLSAPTVYESDTIATMNTKIAAVEGNTYTLWTAKKAEMEKVANTLLVQAGMAPEGTTNYADGTIQVLKMRKVQVDVLAGALRAATRAYGYVQTVSAANPDGDDYVYGKFTAESVAEIRGVVKYVEQYLVDNNLATVTETTDESGITSYTVAAADSSSYTQQLEIDKLVFFILDEIENDSSDRLLLHVNPMESVDGAAAYIDHFAWNHEYDAEGVCTATPTLVNQNKFTGDYSWESLLHLAIEKEGDDNGFVLSNAYYGILSEQINTPFSNDASDPDKYIDIVWSRAEDGTLSLITKDGTAVGATMFTDATWRAYTTALSNANKCLTTTAYLSNNQALIDAEVQSMYDARTGLKLRNFAANTEPYAVAQAYATLVESMQTAYVEIETYSVVENAETGEFEPTITKAQPLIYENTDNAEFIAAVADFRAVYASDGDRTAEFESEEAMIAAKEAIDQIIADNEIQPKLTSHEDFRVGAESLVTGFIAATQDVADEIVTNGTYTNGSYNSDLIAKTDADWDAENGTWRVDSQGYWIDSYLKDIYSNFDPETAVPVTEIEGRYNSAFGSTVSAATNKLYTYVITQKATNLQFAVYMRDNELYKFLKMEIPVGIGDGSAEGSPLYFYYGAPELEDPNYGLYNFSYHVFDQEVLAESVYTAVDSFFAAESTWPLIYQVNGMTYETSEMTGGSTYITGYDYDGSSYVYSGDPVDPAVQQQITDILVRVGSYSSSYTDAMDYINSYSTEHYQWMSESAFTTDSQGNIYILADADIVDGATKPMIYDMAINPDYGIGWYTDGKGYDLDGSGKRYYLYQGTDEVAGSSYNSWFTDDTYANAEMFVDGEASLIGMGIFNIEESSGIIGLPVGETLAETGFSGDYLTSIRANGWSYADHDTFYNMVISEQMAIDWAVNNQYTAMQSLQLLPATQAYRNVVEHYWLAMGKTVNWGDGANDANHIAPTEDELAATADGRAIFYTAAAADSPFITRLLNVDGDLEAGDIVTDSASGYLTAYTIALPAAYNNTDENWSNLDAFYAELTEPSAMLTIDMASEVDGAYDANSKTKLANLIDYLALLQLKDLDYEKLNALVTAFFNNYGTSGLVAATDLFKQEHGLTGNLYDYTKYTHASLLAVLNVMDNYHVIKDSLYDAAKVEGYKFELSYNPSTDVHGDAIYTSAKDQTEINEAHDKIAEAINALQLKDADFTLLKQYIEMAESAEAIPDAYDKTAVDSDGSNLWDTFIAQLDASRELAAKTGYTILNQEEIDTQAENLKIAYDSLLLNADRTAPTLNIDTTSSQMELYYLNSKGESNKVAEYDTHTAQTPTTGTFILPVDGGYDLMVYTNQLNPRILIELKDETSSSSLTSKPEKMTIKAQKTSGTETQVITGTVIDGFVNDDSVNSLVINNTDDGAANIQTYKAQSATEYDENSSLFAILAPNFAEGKQSQAAKYYIYNASDSAASQEHVSGDKFDNNASHLTFDGIEPVSILDENGNAPEMITVYVYYMNNMAADGTDEGVTTDGERAATAYGTSASTVMYKDEATDDGVSWKNGFTLQRSFNSAVRAWEFVDSNVNGIVNPAGGGTSLGPVYVDPNFGSLNTGSFAYVLNSNAAAGTIDRTVIDAYFDAKTTEDTVMDYEAARTAKDVMIEAINAEGAAAFSTMKLATDRFIKYGAYDNWAQNLTEYPNGTLVFVHVLDRWGNVTNRIIEIVRKDSTAPAITANSGTVTITEKGGTGIASIDIWNYLDVDDKSEVQLAEDLTVEENSDVQVKAGVGDESGLEIISVDVNNNTFKVKGLIPLHTYRVSAVDNIGNVGITDTKADEEGCFTITVEDLGDEDAVYPVDVTEQSTAMMMCFSLNSMARVTLNTGISSSVINAEMEGNVFANRYIYHNITTQADVTKIKTVSLADGKETIWTTSSAVVTENDDGTLNWNIDFKLAEGEHSFKVYAMVDGEFETASVPFTLNATTKTVPLTFTVLGVGKTSLYYSGAEQPETNSTYRSTTVPYGAKVTLTAKVAKASSKFYYWQNDSTNRIVSTADTIEYTAVTAADYNAMFTNSASLNSGMKFVIYVNNAKNVIKTFELYEGDSYVVPAGPSLPDHKFIGWSMSLAEVLASDEDTVIVEPVYVLAAENTVTITEGNYTTSGAGVYTSTDTDRAVVSINASAQNDDGEDFLYWIDEETQDIASYNRAYSFNCVKDTVMTPVYGDASTIEEQPVVRINTVRYDGSSGKVNFYSERSIGAQYTLLQTGIVVTKSATVAENAEEFIVGGVATAHGTSTSTTAFGSYSASVKVAADETVWARAYAICETADGEIIEVYSDAVSYTNN